MKGRIWLVNVDKWLQRGHAQRRCKGASSLIIPLISFI
jgi:hypothetical protein